MADEKIKSILQKSESKIYSDRLESMMGDRKKGVSKKSEDVEDKAPTLNKIGRSLGLPTKITNPFDSESEDFLGKVLHVIGTGIPLIDIHLYATDDRLKRGFKSGVHMFTGNAQTTKTTTLNRIMVNTINSEGATDSGYVYYFDKVGNWDKNYFRHGKCGKIEDESRLTSGHFKYQSCSTFKELAMNLEEILATWNNVIIQKITEYNASAKKNEKISLGSIYLPRDICPVVIVIDDFDSYFSENSAGKEFADEAPAESNRDAHRIMQQLLPKLTYLGIQVFIANHFRDQIGGFGPIKVRYPFIWKSIQGYITNAFDFVKIPGRTKTVDGKKVVIDETVMIKIRKAKNAHTSISPIRFVPNRGHDLFDSTLRTLERCGFASLKIKGEEKSSSIESITFITENKLGVRVPKPIFKVLDARQMIGGTFKMKDIAAYLKEDPDFAKELYRATMKSIGRLEVVSDSSLRDYREADVEGDSVPTTDASEPTQPTLDTSDDTSSGGLDGESLDDRLEREEREPKNDEEENIFAEELEEIPED